METAVVILVMCLACGLHLVHSGDTDNLITITPAKLNLTTETAASGGTVTILCEPPKVGVRTLNSVIIFRKLSSGPNATVVNLANMGNDRGQRIPKVYSNNIVATVTGSIGEKYLQLTMSRVRCTDDGVYICETAFFIQSRGNIVITKRINASLSVEVMPDDVTLSAIPSDTKNLAINETLTMICNGSVGTVRWNTMIYWIWEYRLINDSVGDEQWLPYDGGYEDLYEGPTTKPNDCYEFQSINLTRKFTLDDKERIYRCFINKDGRNYTEFAAEFRVAGLVQVTDPTPMSPVDFLKNPAVIGGIAAVFVLLVVTTATIVVRKRRAKPARRSSFRRKYSAGYKAPVERKAAPEDDTTMEDSSSGQFGGPELSESQTSYSEPGENTVDIYNSTSAAKLPNSYPYPEH